MKTEPTPVAFPVPSGELKCTLHTAQSERLAVVLPGVGYSVKQPLLHYGIQILVQTNYRVLAVETLYGDNPAWRSLTNETEARKIVADDATEFFKSVESHFGERVHTVLARSLGTYALASALVRQAVRPDLIVWQTPALREHWKLMRNCGLRGFGILRTNDHFYADAFPNLPDDRIVIDGADHGMEIAGDALRSIEILKNVTTATQVWLAKNLP